MMDNVPLDWTATDVGHLPPYPCLHADMPIYVFQVS